MSFTASARSISGSLCHEIDVNGRHTITTDEPESLGGTDTASAPHELLPAMVASCVSTMIVLYAHRHDWQLHDIRVDVEYDTDPTRERSRSSSICRTTSHRTRRSGFGASPTPARFGGHSKPASRSRRSSFLICTRRRCPTAPSCRQGH